MRKIHRSTEPHALQDANQAGASWNDWDLTIRASIRDQLRHDQLGVCAYCERPITNTRDDKLVIEHFHPRSGGLLWEERTQEEWEASSCRRQAGAKSHSESTTAWNNLLLSCPGKGPHGSDGKIETTCDKRKASTDICESFHNPKLSHLEQIVEIDRGGRAIAATGAPPEASRIINEVLNLNAQFLVDDRKQLIAAQIKAYNTEKAKHKGLKANQKKKIAARIRERAQQPGTAYRSALLSYAREVESKI